MKCIDLLTPTETAHHCRQYREMGEGQRKKTYTDFTTPIFITFQKMEIAKKEATCQRSDLYFRASLRLYHFEDWLMAVAGESKQTAIQ
jgi:hypothetical protein